MNITATSLTDHRIDVKFADYIVEALHCSPEITTETEFLIITNGMYTKANKKVLQAMKELPSLYLQDEINAWIPSKEEYPKCKVLSQFTNRGFDYFQVSKLALFDQRFTDMTPYTTIPETSWVYWGAYKPERDIAKYLAKYLTKGTIIGKNYPDNITKSKAYTMVPFTKDLNILMEEIAKHTHTLIIGDIYTNGVNIPYRIYEALMCRVLPVILPELLGTQSIDIQWIINYFTGGNSEDYFTRLTLEREDIVKELLSHIQVPETVTSVLASRGSIYGSYAEGVKCRVSIMEALNNKHIECRGTDLPTSVQVVFSDISLKLMRAASSPKYLDSWVDLVGYSTLIHTMIREDQDVFNN